MLEILFYMNYYILYVIGRQAIQATNTLAANTFQLYLPNNLAHRKPLRHPNISFEQTSSSSSREYSLDRPELLAIAATHKHPPIFKLPFSLNRT